MGTNSVSRYHTILREQVVGGGQSVMKDYGDAVRCVYGDVKDAIPVGIACSSGCLGKETFHALVFSIENEVEQRCGGLVIQLDAFW